MAAAAAATRRSAPNGSPGLTPAYDGLFGEVGFGWRANLLNSQCQRPSQGAGGAVGDLNYCILKSSVKRPSLITLALLWEG